MNRKIVLFVFVTVLLFSSACPIGSVSSAFPVHNVTSGLHYATIQEAIDAPETLHGHTILVDAGTYYEIITVDKSLTIMGQDRETTIIDGSENMIVVLVKADNVRISDFTIRNSRRDMTVVARINGGNPAGGIALNQSVGCTVANNTIQDCGAGVAICGGLGNHIITRNEIIMASDQFIGIADVFRTVGANIISYNCITGAEAGMGILLASIRYDEIHENRILSCLTGLYLGKSNNTSITQNIIKDNSDSGIRLYYSKDNFIAHNDFIDNTEQVYIDPAFLSTNSWDDGYPSGGNYWSDYPFDGNPFTGEGGDFACGEYQNIPCSDMIGDTPYVINEDNQDMYPLMERWSIPADINRDGIANILDIATAAAAFGSSCAPDDVHLRWNMRADVNRDQQVNIMDVAAIAKDFGWARWQCD